MLSEYELRELRKACERMGGEFVDGRCIIKEINPDIMFHFNWNGWANYETWITKLHLNEENIRWRIRNIIQECKEEVETEYIFGGHYWKAFNDRKEALIVCVADRLHDFLDDERIIAKEKIDEMSSDTKQLFKSLLDTAFDEINWYELAEAYIEEEGLR